MGEQCILECFVIITSPPPRPFNLDSMRLLQRIPQPSFHIFFQLKFRIHILRNHIYHIYIRVGGSKLGQQNTAGSWYCKKVARIYTYRPFGTIYAYFYTILGGDQGWSAFMTFNQIILWISKIQSSGLSRVCWVELLLLSEHLNLLTHHHHHHHQKHHG